MATCAGMSNLVRAISTASTIPVVTLAQLPELAAELAKQVRSGGFQPEFVLYIETGARLIAHEFAPLLGVPLAPMWVRRGGQGLKQRMAPVMERLPVWVRDGLRRLEERSGLHRVTSREVRLPLHLSLAGRRVLLLDDAADTGRTMQVAREAIVARGVAADDLKMAVLAATTPRARSAVDFFVLNRNCRMPWSSDSDERREAERRAEKLRPTHAPRDL